MRIHVCDCGHDKRDHVTSIRTGPATATTCKVCLCNHYVPRIAGSKPSFTLAPHTH